MTTMLWIAIGLLAGGGLLVGIGLLVYRRIQRYLATAVPTEGIILDFKVTEDSDEDTVYFPIFCFRDAEGQEHRITSNTGTNPPGFKKGQSVGIFYDPQHPEDACLDTFWRLWAYYPVRAWRPTGRRGSDPFDVWSPGRLAALSTLYTG